MASIFKTKKQKKQKIVDLLKEGDEYMEVNLNYANNCHTNARLLYYNYCEEYGVDRDLSIHIGRSITAYSKAFTKSD